MRLTTPGTHTSFSHPRGIPAFFRLPMQAFVEAYGAAPEVLVTGDTSLTLPYIPAHLDYML